MNIDGSQKELENVRESLEKKNKKELIDASDNCNGCRYMVGDDEIASEIKSRM